MKEVGDRVPTGEVSKVRDTLEALKKAQEDNNLDEMKEKKDTLSKVAQDLATKLYQANGAQGQADQAGPNPSNNNDGNNGDTVNGDFKKVNPDK